MAEALAAAWAPVARRLGRHQVREGIAVLDRRRGVARGAFPFLRTEAALDHDARLVARRAEPQDVAVAQRRLALDAVVVHVDPARAVRVVHRHPVQVHPDARVDGADAGSVEAEAAVAVRADEDLVHRLVGV
jgi:hypothetical protein